MDADYSFLRCDFGAFDAQDASDNVGMSTPSAAITLAHGSLRAVIRPDLGGSLESLIYCGLAGNVSVLRAPPAVIHTVRDMGCFPMVPFSNRVAKAQLQWQGTDHPLIKMGTTEEHAMHGVVWQRPWEVLEASDDFAMLSHEHKADAAWPFAFDVSQVFKLDGSTLNLTLSITNQAPSPAPVGLGWHPYFAKRPSAHIAFEATSRWEMGADKLPTVLQAIPSMASSCANLDVDHCFEGWTGAATLSDALLRIRIESNLTRLVVYTKPSIDCIAIEPVSHANNAINLAGANAAELARLGVRVLASGETFSAQMSINVEAA
jgi:aldose 1-epimerase